MHRCPGQHRNRAYLHYSNTVEVVLHSGIRSGKYNHSDDANTVLQLPLAQCRLLPLNVVRWCRPTTHHSGTCEPTSLTPATSTPPPTCLLRQVKQQALVAAVSRARVLAEDAPRWQHHRSPLILHHGQFGHLGRWCAPARRLPLVASLAVGGLPLRCVLQASKSHTNGRVTLPPPDLAYAYGQNTSCRGPSVQPSRNTGHMRASLQKGSAQANHARMCYARTSTQLGHALRPFPCTCLDSRPPLLLLHLPAGCSLLPRATHVHAPSLHTRKDMQGHVKVHPSNRAHCWSRRTHAHKV